MEPTRGRAFRDAIATVASFHQTLMTILPTPQAIAYNRQRVTYYDFLVAGMTIFDTVIVSSFISPVSLTVWPEWICKSARSWFAML
jgi:hypothetical protein